MDVGVEAFTVAVAAAASRPAPSRRLARVLSSSARLRAGGLTSGCVPGRGAVGEWKDDVEDGFGDGRI